MSASRASLILSAILVLPSLARADIAPPPSECDTLADGTACSLPTGPGRCKTEHGKRTWHTCVVDTKQCERLAVGAVCDGYLHRPAHCRRFESADKKTRWVTCQEDAAGEAAAATPPATPTVALPAPTVPAMAASAPVAATDGGAPVAAPAAPGPLARPMMARSTEARTDVTEDDGGKAGAASSCGCAVGRAPSGSLALLLLVVAVALTARRRRR